MKKYYRRYSVFPFAQSRPKRPPFSGATPAMLQINLAFGKLWLPARQRSSRTSVCTFVCTKHKEKVSLTYWPEEVVCRASSPLEFVFWPRIGNEGVDSRRMAHHVPGNCSICDAAEKRRKANNLLSSGLRLKGELNTFDKLFPAFWE